MAVIIDPDVREAFLQHPDLVDRLRQCGSVTEDPGGGLQRGLHVRPDVGDSVDPLGMTTEFAFQPLCLGACLSVR